MTKTAAEKSMAAIKKAIEIKKAREAREAREATIGNLYMALSALPTSNEAEEMKLNKATREAIYNAVQQIKYAINNI